MKKVIDRCMGFALIEETLSDGSKVYAIDHSAMEIDLDETDKDKALAIFNKLVNLSEDFGYIRGKAN